ncbi:LacI family DNA-binding transcriptional regulator [Luteolibacter luteus]|uniref:LacI family transcriptional regulator n=1 Tax=Luteolibacter luteus TaxID=2728835 RepID=A0A858RJI9_9BACT|nr:LacI family DNA-binding transcriptional regulator [Luteolibacter luteus]QJE97087.1 LacI family transcriptional regulator [Luteolibacter luteus]
MSRAAAGPVSQRDIARHFGVSHVTVSLALRHSNRVSKSLGDRIRDHAEAVGYQRDPLLAALAAYRYRKSRHTIRGVVAWINAWPDSGRMLLDPCISRYWQGASEAATESGYRLEEFRLGTDLSAERLHQVLRTRNIQGILLPPHSPVTDWHGLPWEDYDIVGLGSWEHGPRSQRVMPAIKANLSMALGKITAAGYARIACVSGNSVLRESGYCMEEWLPSMKRHVEVPFLDLAEVSGEAAVRLAGDWIRRNRIEAVLTDHVPLARSLREARFPVVTMSASEGSKLTGVDPEFEEIGRTAVRMLDSLTSEGTGGPARLFRQVAIEGTWREGSSFPG